LPRAARFEVLQPTGDHAIEVFPVEAVVAATALPPDVHETGLLEDLEVPAGRGPAVLEA